MRMAAPAGIRLAAVLKDTTGSCVKSELLSASVSPVYMVEHVKKNLATIDVNVFQVRYVYIACVFRKKHY